MAEPDFTKGASGPDNPYDTSATGLGLTPAYLGGAVATATGGGASVAGTNVTKNGVAVATEAKLDFLDGDVVWTATDDVPNTRVRVQGAIGASKITSAMILDGTIVSADVGFVFSSFTPVITTFDLGSGTADPNMGATGSQIGRYIQLGKLVIAWGSLVWGGAGVSNGTGGYKINFPVTADAAHEASVHLVGTARLADASTNVRIAMATYRDANYFQMYMEGANIIVNRNDPAGWGVAGARIDFQLMYEAS